MGYVAPVVSIVMPTYNQAGWLPSALASILSQEYQDWELICVDDGSTDSTPEILASWASLHSARIRVVTHSTNRGTAEAINTGARKSFGWLRTWVSSDNVMHSDWLAKMVPILKSRPKVGAVYSGFTYRRLDVDGNEINRGHHFTMHHPDRLIGQLDCYYGPAFVLRTDTWMAVGPHRGAISHDYDHWLRVEEVCQQLRLEIVGLPGSLCTYNAHPARVTVTRSDQYDAAHWHQRALKRRGLK